MMTVLDHFVHQFPGFLEKLFVDGRPGRVVVQGGGQSALQSIEEHLERL